MPDEPWAEEREELAARLSSLDAELDDLQHDLRTARSRIEEDGSMPSSLEDELRSARDERFRIDQEVSEAERSLGNLQDNRVRVVLANGRVVEGRLVRETGRRLVLGVPGGRVSFERREVSTIHRTGEEERRRLGRGLERARRRLRTSTQRIRRLEETSERRGDRRRELLARVDLLEDRRRELLADRRETARELGLLETLARDAQAALGRSAAGDLRALEPLRVDIYPEGDPDASMFEYVASRDDEIGPRGRHVNLGIRKLDEVVPRLEELCFDPATGEQVAALSELRWLGHGSVGSTDVGDLDLSYGTLDFLDGLADLCLPDSHHVFLACNTGRGRAGQAFLREYLYSLGEDSAATAEAFTDFSLSWRIPLLSVHSEPYVPRKLYARVAPGRAVSLREVERGWLLPGEVERDVPSPTRRLQHLEESIQSFQDLGERLQDWLERREEGQAQVLLTLLNPALEELTRIECDLSSRVVAAEDARSLDAGIARGESRLRRWASHGDPWGNFAQEFWDSALGDPDIPEFRRFSEYVPEASKTKSGIDYDEDRLLLRDLSGHARPRRRPALLGDRFEREAHRLEQRLLQGRDLAPASPGPARTGDDVGPGRGLPRSVRGHLESFFGTDLGFVSLRVDSFARRAVDRAGAIGMAVGSEVWLGSGAPPVGTAAGMALVGHEVTHILQGSRRSSGAGIRVGRTRTAGLRPAASRRVERLADRAIRRAERILEGEGAIPVHDVEIDRLRVELPGGLERMDDRELLEHIVRGIVGELR